MVTMLNATSIVVNSILAPFFLGEQFLRRHLYGNLLCIGGAVLIVLFTSTVEQVFTVDTVGAMWGQPKVIVFVMATGFVLGGLFFLRKKYATKYVQVDVTITSIFGTLQSRFSSSGIFYMNIPPIYRGIYRLVDKSVGIPSQDL